MEHWASIFVLWLLASLQDYAPDEPAEHSPSVYHADSRDGVQVPRKGLFAGSWRVPISASPQVRTSVSVAAEFAQAQGVRATQTPRARLLTPPYFG